MATRAEQHRSDAQRTGQSRRRSTKKPRKASWSHDKAHARSKATHALETVAGGRPSRESTRGGANRTKADAAFNLTEESRQNAPPARARRAATKEKRVRGATSTAGRQGSR